MKKIVVLAVTVIALTIYGTSIYADPHPHGGGGSGGQGGGGGGAGGSSTVTTTVNNTANGGSATGGSAVVGDTSSSSTIGNVTSSASSSTGGASQNVEGDNVQIYGHSSAPAAKGTSAVSIGTLIGGISVAHTETYVKIRGHIAELVALHNAGLVGDGGVLTETEWTNDYRKAIKRLSHVSRHGERTLMNLFGIIR